MVPKNRESNWTISFMLKGRKNSGSKNTKSTNNRVSSWFRAETKLGQRRLNFRISFDKSKRKSKILSVWFLTSISKIRRRDSLWRKWVPRQDTQVCHRGICSRDLLSLIECKEESRSKLRPSVLFIRVFHLVWSERKLTNCLPIRTTTFSRIWNRQRNKITWITIASMAITTTNSMITMSTRSTCPCFQWTRMHW